MNPIKDIADEVVGVVEKYFPSKLDKEKVNLMAKEIAQKAQETAQQIPLAQIKVDEAEANNPNFFVSAARSFVVWVCGAKLLFAWIVYPFIGFIGHLLGFNIILPPDDIATPLAILGALFGMHTLSTFKKVKGL